MFKPIRDVIIVKKAEDETKSKGGIFIPSTVESARSVFRGTIVACGDGILTESGNIVPLKVKEGDSIVFGKTGGVEIQIEGDTFVMMRENNILGIE